MYMLSIRGEPSAESWAALAKAVKQLPGVLDITDTGRAQCGISATRKTLLSAGRGDLKVILEAVVGADVMYSAGGFYGGRVHIEEEGEEGWEKLEQLLDMSEDQWRAEAHQFLEGDSLNSTWDSLNSEWDSPYSSFIRGGG